MRECDSVLVFCIGICIKMGKLYFISPIVTQFVIRIITKVLFGLFCGLSVRGLENLDGHSGPFIFASNHTSEWDGPLIRTVMPVVSRFAPMFYVALEKKFYTNSSWRRVVYGGGIFKLVGAHPVYPGLKNYKESLRNHIKIIEDGGCVTIFPEGARTRTGDMNEFKPGVIALADMTDTPIVPVTVKGNYRLTLKSFLMRKHRVVVSFGKPIRVPKNLKIEGYKKQTALLRGEVAKLF